MLPLDTIVTVQLWRKRCTSQQQELRALRGVNETILAFLFHMVGFDTLLAKSHLNINLEEFAPRIESEELKILANSKVNDTDYTPYHVKKMVNTYGSKAMQDNT